MIQDKIILKSSGDNSPNSVQILEGIKGNTSREIISIMRIIEILSKLSENTKLTREDVEKDVGKKFEYFKNYEKELKDEYKKTYLIYGGIYDEAMKQSSISEITAEKIALLLQYKSKEELEKSNGDPIKALSSLTQLLTEYHESKNVLKKDSDTIYDQAAIRFYLFKELIKCNIFPNPIEL